MATPTNQFRLKLAPSTYYNFTVKWGDGTSEIYNQITSSNEDLAGLTHTYPTPNVYTLSAYANDDDGFIRIYYNGTENASSTNDDIKITNINNWGNNFTTLANSFEGCINLSGISMGDNGSLSGISNFDSAFKNCQSLSSFPLINTSNGTNFDEAWRRCPSLTNFPLLDTSKGTTFNSTWFDCTNLKSFPPINILSAANISSAWKNCQSLTSFPNISTSNVKFFNQAWYGCMSLSSFPLINTSKGTYFDLTWTNCNKLTSFPVINTLSGNSFQYTWCGCTSLTAFPLINTSNGTNFYGTWSSCVSLSASHFPAVDMRNMTDGTDCFYGVKLTTTSYSALLTSICATNINTGVTFHGGNSNFLIKAIPARQYLTTDRLWTINDGGLEPFETTGNGGSYYFKVAMSDDGQYITISRGEFYNVYQLYMTKDGGATWSLKNPSIAGYDIAIAPSNGLIQTAVNYNTGYIYTTSDAWDTYQLRTSSGTATWGCVKTSQNGQIQVAGSWSGKVVVSTDFGATWTNKTVPNRQYYNAGCSYDGTKMILGAWASGGVLISTNSGSTFVDISKFSNTDVRSVAVSKDGLVFFVNSENSLYYSKDNGSSWTKTWTSGQIFDLSSNYDGSLLLGTSLGISSNYGRSRIPFPGVSGFVRGVAINSTGDKMVCCVATSPTGYIYKKFEL
jgi:photosystem II stability/assembly factor-like uncharacterized protein